jgi:hypothetical protein
MVNLAFYSCFYGDNNNPAFAIPAIPSEKYPCYFFSNNLFLINVVKKHTKWIGIWQDKPITSDLVESCNMGKHIKVCSHEYAELNKYDYLCFLDSKLDKVNDVFVEEMIQKYFIEQNYALILRKHPFLPGSVWNEFINSMEQPRYITQCERYVNYINNQKKRGLSETVEKNCACGFQIKNMMHEKINELNDVWYKHIQECGIQDQISFFFVKQLYEDYIVATPDWPFV